MSLEAALAELTTEIKALREETAALRQLRSDAIETVRAAATPAAGKKKAAEPKAEAPAAETTPAAEPKAEAEATPSPELNEVQAAVAAYVGQEGISAEERAARSGKVKEILSKVGAAKVSDVPEAKGPAVIKAMKTLLEQGNLIKDAPAADDDLLG